MFEFLKKSLSKENAAKLLKLNPDALEAFEKAYHKASIYEEDNSDNFFDMNSRRAVAELQENMSATTTDLTAITEKIINELLAETGIKQLPDHQTTPVTNADLRTIPEELRPQLTGNMMKIDINAPSYAAVLDMYARSLHEKNPKKAKDFYHQFRQGLDILDLDPVLYQIIGMNKNTIGYWFPALHAAANMQDFFKVPKTKIIKVPLTLLQLTRNDYMSLTPTTLDIVNQWAYEAFELDENKTYFIKTGTYSSKFDFRNAKVTTPKEVRELGSYLLFIHFQALQMASPLSQPSIYGVSTTNEWCVREYIEDKENNPCIYHGMPLHTEYRVFIDCDENKVLGIAPYWKPDVMKNRFANASDSETADKKHDWIIYSMHEETLMQRYEENKDMIVDKINDMLPDISANGLTGQWSLDVMQNGDDFWLIDMATADTSALNDCIPKGLMKKSEENWIPELS